ncbi:hypothetical protein BsWGS_16883 [Bradybaena similaris]
MINDCIVLSCLIGWHVCVGTYDNPTSKAPASTIRKVGYDDPTSQTSASKIQKDGEDEEEEEAQEDVSTFLPPLLVIVGAVVITVVMIARKGMFHIPATVVSYCRSCCDYRGDDCEKREKDQTKGINHFRQ